jgi:hypothetical protein
MFKKKFLLIGLLTTIIAYGNDNLSAIKDCAKKLRNLLMVENYNNPSERPDVVLETKMSSKELTKWLNRIDDTTLPKHLEYVLNYAHTIATESIENLTEYKHNNPLYTESDPLFPVLNTIQAQAQHELKTLKNRLSKQQSQDQKQQEKPDKTQILDQETQSYSSAVPTIAANKKTLQARYTWLRILPPAFAFAIGILAWLNPRYWRRIS